MPLLAAVAALTTSLLLLASAAGHLRRPAAFAADLGAQHVLTPGARRAVVLALPAVELALGIAGAVTLGGVALAAQAGLFTAFAGYLAVAARGGAVGVPCACGLPDAPVGGGAIVRAVALAGLALLGALASAGVPEDVAGRALLAVAAPTLALLVAVVPAARRLPTSTGATA